MILEVCPPRPHQLFLKPCTPSAGIFRRLAGCSPQGLLTQIPALMYKELTQFLRLFHLLAVFVSSACPPQPPFGCASLNSRVNFDLHRAVVSNLQH